jgi:hypothetical protein
MVSVTDHYGSIPDFLDWKSRSGKSEEIKFFTLSGLELGSLCPPAIPVVLPTGKCM